MKEEERHKNYATLVHEKKEELVTRILWADVLSNNRNPENGMIIEFVAPKLVNGELEIEIE